MLKLKKFFVLLFVAVSVLVLSACNAVDATIRFEGQISRSDNGVITLGDGARITALEPVTLNGDDGTEIRLEAGQSAVAYGEVELDLGGDSAGYIGTFYVTSEDVTEECPVTTEEAPVSTEQAPTEEPETNVSSESWVCVNGDMEAAMASTTWTRIFSIRDREVYSWEECPWDKEVDEYFYWTQLSPGGESLEDGQWWWGENTQDFILNLPANMGGVIVAND